MRAIAGLALLLSLGCANTDIASVSGSPDPAWRLQKALDRAVSLRPGRSGVLLVDVPGGLHFEGASGVSDPHTGRRAEPGDRFRTASITKMVTAALVMMLVEEGRVSLDGNLLPYLPAELVDRLHVGLFGPLGLNDRTSRGRDITVRHLLTHTSGLRDYYTVDRNQDGLGDIVQTVIADPRRHWQPLELMEHVIAAGPPWSVPGRSYFYGDTGYVVLGLAAEAASGAPLHRAYRERIFSPLGMVNTHLQWYEPEPEGPPVAHAYITVRTAVHELASTVDTASWAGSGLVSNTGDLARFGRAVFEGGFFTDAATLREMTRWTELGVWRYGLGVARLFPAGAEMWGHTGQWGSFLYYWPQRRVIVCGTLNDDRADVEAFLGEVVRIVEEER
jgi:D-alanyl-D-alanine carboxypeptidase